MSGCWVIFLADSEDLEEATRSTRRAPHHSPHPDQAGPSTTHHQSSDYDEVLRRLDSLSTSAREFAAWQNDMTAYQDSMASWQGDMMRGLYANLGYSGYTSPPRPSFFHHEPTRDMPTTDDIPMYDDFATDAGMDTTFARADDEEEDAETDENTDGSNDDGDDQYNEEVAASDQHESPDHYQLVYRRRNRN